MMERKRYRVIMVTWFMLAACVLMAGCRNKRAGEAKHASAKLVDAGNVELKHTLYLGEVKSLAADDEEILSCTSSKPEVVSVSQNGTLHALKRGSAKITVKTSIMDGDDDDGNDEEDSDGGRVDIRIYRIKVRKSGMVYPNFSMMKGEHLDMQFNMADVHAVWESDNPGVAKVSKDGKVIARKTGSARLTAKTKDGRKYRCRLKVTKRIKSVIYLTFDDGPSRYSTTRILNILKKNKIKATFFELKPAKNDYDLTKRVIDEGHTLALHGYQHKYDIVYQSQKAYRNNLDLLRNLFYKKFGVWCTVSRFPGGSSNTSSRYNPGIMTKLTRKVHGWGYHYFDWNVDSQDAGGARSSSDTFNNFKNGLVKGRSNVVLMHDFSGNDKTISALEKMIQYGKKQGYTFLPITASTDEVHHGVNN